MIYLLWLVLTTFVLGPAGGVAYSFSQQLPFVETAVAVSAIHLALVPVWFGIFKLINYEKCYKNRLISQVLEKTKIRSKIKPELENKLHDFEARVGQFGFAAGVVGFTFLFGVSWAVLGSYLLNIKNRTMMIAISIGAVASSLFWTFVFVWAVRFMPGSWFVYIAGTALTFAILGHKKLHERRLIRDMSKSLKKLGIRIR